MMDRISWRARLFAGEYASADKDLSLIAHASGTTEYFGRSSDWATPVSEVHLVCVRDNLAWLRTQRNPIDPDAEIAPTMTVLVEGSSNAVDESITRIDITVRDRTVHAKVCSAGAWKIDCAPFEMNENDLAWEIVLTVLQRMFPDSHD